MMRKNRIFCERPVVALASASAAGKPMATQSPVVHRPSCIDVQATSIR